MWPNKCGFSSAHVGRFCARIFIWCAEQFSNLQNLIFYLHIESAWSLMSLTPDLPRTVDGPESDLDIFAPIAK